MHSHIQGSSHPGQARAGRGEKAAVWKAACWGEEGPFGHRIHCLFHLNWAVQRRGWGSWRSRRGLTLAPGRNLQYLQQGQQDPASGKGSWAAPGPGQRSFASQLGSVSVS